MSEKWSFSGAKLIGKLHEKLGLSCQDSIMSTEENGVLVIALSDGCSSSPLAEVGASITVELLCKLFTESFDELYGLEEREIKQRIITTINSKIRDYISVEENRKAIIDIINKQLPIYETLTKRYKKAKAQNNNEEIDYYLTTALNATVQAVAIKDERIIIVRLGDGLIGEIRNGELKITSSEDKLFDTESNKTYYPSYSGFIRNDYNNDCWEIFEVIKGENASEYDLIFIVCDGVADLIRYPDGDEKYIKPSEMDKVIKHINDPLPLLEKYKKMEKDDLSIIMLKSREPSYEMVVLREYDQNGKTINNSKLVPKEELFEEEEETIDQDVLTNTAILLIKEELEREEAIDQELSTNTVTLLTKEELEEDNSDDEYIKECLEFGGFTKNLFSKEETERIKEYLDDEEYFPYFLEQASNIKEHLENGGDGMFSTIRSMLGDLVDDEDFKLLIEKISYLKLFYIDRINKIISKDEINET